MTEKKERERARKKSGAINGKKIPQKSKFWLLRMHQIKIFHIFVPNLGKIYQFGNKIAFSVKLRLVNEIRILTRALKLEINIKHMKISFNKSRYFLESDI